MKLLFPKKLMIVFIFIVLANGCAKQLVIHTIKQGDATRCRLAGNTTLLNPENIIDMSMSLDIERVTTEKKPAAYYLQLSYVDNDYIYISSGASLKLILDQDKQLVFTGKGSEDYRKVLSYGEKQKVIERASYMITPKEIHQISLAKKVDVEISGREKTYNRQISESTLMSIQEFIKHYYKPQ